MEHQKYKHRVKTNYEAERDLLIPKAERFADAVCGKEPLNTSKHYREWADRWNREYHSRMNELAKELLL